MSKSNDSKFTLSTDFLSRSLKFLRGLAPAETIRFISNDGRVLSLESVTPSAHVSIEARTANLSGACDFSVPADAFAKAIKGAKDDYEFRYSDNEGSLTIHTGRTKITLQVVDGNATEMPSCDADWYELSGDDADWLSSAVKKVALKPLAALNSHMQGIVHLSSKGSTVACIDDSRMAFLSNKELKGSLQLSLPISTLQPVFDAFAKTDFSIAVTDSALFMRSKLVRACLMLPDTGVGGVIDAKEVLERIAEVRASAGECAQVELNRDECMTFLENTQAVATKERLALDVKLAKGEGRLQVKTAAGAATTVLEATGNVEFSVDLSFFEEALARSETQALLVAEHYIVLVGGEPTIVVALNGVSN